MGNKDCYVADRILINLPTPRHVVSTPLLDPAAMAQGGMPATLFRWWHERGGEGRQRTPVAQQAKSFIGADARCQALRLRNRYCETVRGSAYLDRRMNPNDHAWG